MKLQINLGKKYLFGIIVISLIAISFAGVYASYPLDVFGHNPNELDWGQAIGSDVIAAEKFGIGTDVPGAKIHINGTGYAGMFVENSGKKFSFYANNAGNLVIGDEVAGTARIIVNGSTGNIGIGTASPTEKLEVSGNVRAESLISSSGAMNASKICLSGDCQTGWPSSSDYLGVRHGTISNGGTIPLPSGFIESECFWLVSDNNPGSAADRSMDYIRAYTTGRVVTCTYSREDKSAVNSITCNYIIVCTH